MAKNKTFSIDVAIGELLNGSAALLDTFQALNQAKGLTGLAVYKIAKGVNEIKAVVKEQQEVLEKLIADAEIVKPDYKKIMELYEGQIETEKANAISKARDTYLKAVNDNEKISSYLKQTINIDFPKSFKIEDFETLEYDVEAKKYFQKCVINAAQLATIEKLIEE